MDDNIYTEPKLIKRKSDTIFGYACPTCNMDVLPKTPSVCMYCGQLLLWPDIPARRIDTRGYVEDVLNANRQRIAAEAFDGR